MFFLLPTSDLGYCDFHSENSDLWHYDPQATRKVLSLTIPQPLINQVGLDVLIKRLPEQYAKSMFSSYVASRFIYEHGVRASQVDFLQFFTSLGKR